MTGREDSQDARADPGLTGPLVVGGAAILIRLAYFAEYRHSPFFDFLHLDPLYYFEWATRIASGEWIGREVFEQSPLYPYLLALYVGIFGQDLTLLRLIHFAIGSATAVLTCVLAARLFGRSAGICAGLLAAFYGPLLFFEGQVMKEFLTPFFSIAMLLLFDLAVTRTKGRGILLAASGACIGLAALVRDNVLLVLPCLALYLLLARRGPRHRVVVGSSTGGRQEAADRAAHREGRSAGERHEAIPDPSPLRQGVSTGARHEQAAGGSAVRQGGGMRGRLQEALLLAAGALVILLPVGLRNYAVSGDLVLTTSGGGEVFYIGNGPWANGAYIVPPWVRSSPKFEHEDFRAKARELTGRDLSRAEASRFWWREGVKTILSDPLRWGRLEARKAMLLLNDHELPDNYSYGSFMRFSRILPWVPTFGAVLALAAAGMASAAARWRDLLPLALAGASYMASVMLFFNFGRFRIPLLPILFIFAGAGLVAMARSARTLWRSSPRPPASEMRKAALLGLLVTGVWLGSRIDLHTGAEEPFQDRLHLAAAWRKAGRLDEAEEILRRTISEAEEILARRGWKRGDTAVPGGVTFALSLHTAHRDLAGILIERKRRREAIEELRAALPLDPNDAAIYQILGGALLAEGDAQGAISVLRRGVGVKPGSFTMRFDLATALYEQGDARGALEELRAAADRNPDLPDLDRADWHYGMGVALLALPGNEDDGLEHLKLALALNASHPHAAEARAEIARRQR